MFEITFGMALDGARWAEEPASIGKMKCGPLGLLKFIETQYALGGVEGISDRCGIGLLRGMSECYDCENSLVFGH